MPRVGARVARAGRVVAPILLSIVAALAVHGRAGAAPAHAAQATTDDARRTYLSDCAVCHGSDAAGTQRGPSLREVGRASVDYMVTTGRMPLAEPDDRLERRPSRYPPALQSALVDYVVSLGVTGPDIPPVDVAAGDVSRGAELYRLQCAACHAWSGGGGALLGREAPPVTAATPVQAAEAIRTGPGTMPVFGTAAIDDTQLDDVVAYVESLRAPDDRGGHPLWHLGPIAEGGAGIVGGLGLLLLAVRWIGTAKR